MTAEDSKQPMDLALYVEGRFKPVVAEGTSINPVGAIIFDDNKKAVFLVAEQNGKIHAEGGDLPPDFTSDSLPGWEGRVFSLPHLKDLMVFQTLMGAVTVRAMDSVVSDKAVVSAHITTYTDAQNSESEINKSIFLEEKELLGALRGEAGGVVAFRGIGLPEDNAFLIERKNADSRYGMLFFLRPNSLEEQGIDSLQGLHSFLLAVNTAFKEQSPLPFQTESLALLEDNFRLGFLDIKSPLRRELLRSFVIATARLYDQDQGYRYREELQKIITGLDSNWWWFYSSRFFTQNMRWEASQSGTRAANEALNGVIIGSVNKRKESRKLLIEDRKGVALLDTNPTVATNAGWRVFHPRIDPRVEYKEAGHSRIFEDNGLLDLNDLGGIKYQPMDMRLHYYVMPDTSVRRIAISLKKISRIDNGGIYDEKELQTLILKDNSDPASTADFDLVVFNNIHDGKEYFVKIRPAGDSSFEIRLFERVSKVMMVG